MSEMECFYQMSCCCTELGLLVTTLVFIIYIFVQHKFSYWKKRNVTHTPPTFPLGSCEGISRTRNLGDILKLKYMEGHGKPYTGIYILFSPGLLIRDPDLIRIVLSKDFTSFSGRGFQVNPDLDPLTGHLFFLDGPQWRNLRTKLTPAFTSGKMKAMFPIIEECTNEMNSYLTGKDVVEVGDLFTRYTTNVVTRCAYGIDVDFFRNPDPMLEKMVHRTANPTLLDAIKRGIAFSVGHFTGTLPLRLVPKKLSDYFIGLVKQTMDNREKDNVERKDFMQLLIELKNKGYLLDPDAAKGFIDPQATTQFTLNEAAAQAFSFLIGGFDTSFVTMECCLYELALKPDIQEKVRNEVTDVFKETGGKMTYDSLIEMTYLEQVIQETLRLHPAAPLLSRECTRPFQLPNSDLLLDVGSKIWISTKGLHSDPSFFPQPEIFDPERFSSQNKSKIKQYTFLPFGDGPRACIGNRFAVMQMKAGIAAILQKFRVELCENTPAPPLKTDPKKAVASIMGGVPLRIVPL